jgi:mannose-6-phosphate isomerase-like protein (cupin superfamily)
MMACRTASIFAFGALFTMGAIAACREAAEPEVPPLTTAHPSETVSPLMSAKPMHSASMAVVDASASIVAPAVAPPPSPIVTFLESGTKKIETPTCTRTFITVAKGSAKVGTDSLGVGDVLVLAFAPPVDVQVSGVGGLGVVVQSEIQVCAVLSNPGPVKTLIHAKDAPDLKWANGTMHAHLDVGAQTSPDLYFGRLEGTAPVAPHEHEHSGETIIAIEANGTFTFDGKESHLGPKQVLYVPRGIKHSWKPAPGSKLVAIQLYDPPGPEQRFVGLAARAATDAGPPDMDSALHQKSD